MTDGKDRDVLDVTSQGQAAQGEKPQRPVVSPQEGAYFLDKFLEEKKEPTDEAAAATDAPASAEELQANIVSALQEIFDPEIPVNIYELGLIYGVDVADDYSVKVTMTLTTPHCPVAESMPGEVELKVNSVTGVTSTEVDLVWDPPWDMSKMSDEARLELGLL